MSSQTPVEDKVVHLTVTIVGLLIIFAGGIMLLLRALNLVEFGNGWVVAGAGVVFMCTVAQDNATEEGDDDWSDILPP